MDVLKLLCWDVCRRCCGCHFEDAHAVGGGFCAGVSAEEVEWGTEGGECFHTVTHSNTQNPAGKTKPEWSKLVYC